jgi:hypothetical protein
MFESWKLMLIKQRQVYKSVCRERLPATINEVVVVIIVVFISIIIIIII